MATIGSPEEEDADAPPGSSLNPSSELGTLAYWEHAYAVEVSNLEASHGADVGHDWFAETVGDRLITFICEDGAGGLLDAARDVDALDLGAGNGTFLFELEAARPWRGALVGVDYAEGAVDLARRVAAAHGSAAEFRLGAIGAGTVLRPGETFGLVHDKGTFDAYMLSAGGSVGEYAECAAAALGDGGAFVITSCNYTADELRGFFEAPRRNRSRASSDSGGAPEEEAPACSSSWRFEYVDQIRYPTFRFGGAQGAAVSTVAFRLLRDTES